MRQCHLFCDRCGNEIPPGADWVRLTIQRAKEENDCAVYEICMVCTNHLLRWVKE